MNFRSRRQPVSRGANPPRRALVGALPLTAFVLVFLALVVGGAATGLAKEKKPPSKTVTGVVLDNANNTLDGATVELTDLQSGKVLDIYSQQGGQYQFADLSLDHDYKIKAMYRGKSSEERQVSSIDTRTRPVMNLTIPITAHP